MLESEGLVSSDVADQHAKSENKLDAIYIKNDLMYQHNLMTINYMTYDVRQSQDTINSNTDHRDIMLLSPQKVADPASSGHKYQYAQVLGIYHVHVICAIRNCYHLRHMELLWVQYFEIIDDVSVQNAWSTAQLDKIKF